MSALPLQPDPLYGLVPAIDELPVLPQVAFRIMDLTDGDLGSASFLHTVMLDPGFCARVLAKANSSGFRLLREVTSIREALEVVGAHGVQEIAASTRRYSNFAGKTDAASLRHRAWWRQSVDSAVCCGWLFADRGAGSQESGYTAGLLHYAGKLILELSNPEAYDRFDERSHSVEEVIAFECQSFGYDHAQVSSAAATVWGLPQSLVGALDYVRREDGNKGRASLAIASHIAKLAVNGSEANGISLPDWALCTLGVSPADAHVLISQGIGEIASSEVMQL